MKLRAQNPPHIRSRESNLTVMADVVIALLPLYAMAAYYYGGRALMLGLTGVSCAVAADLLCTVISRRVPNIRDFSPVVTGLIIPLLMPASIGFEVVAAAALFAIAVAKHPFGGVGQNVFNPAAAGVAFAVVCWPKAMFAYPVPFERLPIEVGEAVRLVSSPSKALSLGGMPTVDLLDMLLGNVPGPMGATHILVLLTCLLFLTVRKIIHLPMTALFLTSAALTAFVFPRADMASALSVRYEMMSGILLFCALFLLNDPVTSPKRASPKMLYGLLAGIMVMLFRRLGRYEESLLFALLVMNAAVWMLDVWGERTAHVFRRKNRESKTHSALSAQAAGNVGDPEE